eukprot:PhM_4_TR12441/c0_g1_i1/m.83285/K12486/SMAP; stromal membrane-associated protein
MASYTAALEGLLSQDPQNQYCADCHAHGTRWASLNLGIFMCMRCSGIHRSLGTHISKVRSITLDKWTKEEVDFVAAMGNSRAALLWEAKLRPGVRPTDGTTEDAKVQAFIQAKYVERAYAMPAEQLEEELNRAYNQSGYYPSKEAKRAARKLAKKEASSTTPASSLTTTTTTTSTTSKVVEPLVEVGYFGPLFPPRTQSQLTVRYNTLLSDVFKLKD